MSLTDYLLAPFRMVRYLALAHWPYTKDYRIYINAKGIAPRMNMQEATDLFAAANTLGSQTVEAFLAEFSTKLEAAGLNGVSQNDLRGCGYGLTLTGKDRNGRVFIILRLSPKAARIARRMANTHKLEWQPQARLC